MPRPIENTPKHSRLTGAQFMPLQYWQVYYCGESKRGSAHTQMPTDTQAETRRL